MEAHVVEDDPCAADLEALGIGPVDDLRRDVEEIEHRLDIDQPLLDLAVDHADEVEWDGKLKKQRVDQNEIADCLLAAHYRRRRHRHAHRLPDGEDDDLPDVKPGDRRPDADRRLLVARHGAVVASGFHLLVAEIFDRLEVEERVDRLRVRVLVGFVHRPADTHPPVGDFHREPDVDDDGDADDDEIGPVELVSDDRRRERELEERRQRVQDREADDRFDAVDAALDDALQATGPPLQVIAERQLVHVDERDVGEIPDRVLADLCEQRVSEVVEHVHQDAADAVGDDQHDRDGENRGEANGRGSVGSGDHVGHRVGRPLVGVGDENGDDLGGDQNAEGETDTPLQVGAVRRPHVRPQLGERDEHRLAPHRHRAWLRGVVGEAHRGALVRRPVKAGSIIGSRRMRPGTRSR